MGHLDDVTADDLRTALDEAEGKKPTLRLVTAIAYKHGVTQTELAEWLGVERRTVYNWLTRFEDAPPAEATLDADRPGRPRKLDADQRVRLETTLHDPPTEAGYDAEWWTPALVRRHVETTFGVDYSIPSCRRLMKEAGLRFESGPSGASESSEGRGGRWVVDYAGDGS